MSMRFASGACTTLQYTQILQQIVSFSRERKGKNLYVFEKKGRAKNLPIGMVKLGRGVGGRGSALIVQTEPWLGFRRGAGGQCATMNE
jgi:hypothetical protein